MNVSEGVNLLVRSVDLAVRSNRYPNHAAVLDSILNNFKDLIGDEKKRMYKA